MKVIDHKRLQKLQAIQEVSARRLAIAAGYESHTYMARILRGEVKTLRVEPACRIADFFGVGVDDLFLVQTSSEAEHIAKRSKTGAAA